MKPGALQFRFFVSGMGRNSPSISQKFFRLAIARHEGRGTQGRGGEETEGRGGDGRGKGPGGLGGNCSITVGGG
jgi:hypothetical protein